MKFIVNQKIKNYFFILSIMAAVFGLTVGACKKPVDLTNAVVIEKMYATSTSGFSNHVTNIFGSGSWNSYPMKHGVEGIMIYLADTKTLGNSGPVQLGSYIKAIEISCNNSNNNEIIINGSGKRHWQCNQALLIDKRVSSIFLKEQPGNEGSFEIEKVKFLDDKNAARPVVFPEALSGKVTASSTLEPASAYAAYLVFDGKPEFAWAEGKKGSDPGTSEKITISLDKEIELTGFEIYPGYQRSSSHFQKNATPVSLLVSNGSSSETAKFINAMGSQRVHLSKALKGKEFTFSIEKVRKGSKWQDTLISEIVLLSGQNRYTVYDNRIEKQKNKLLAKIKGSNLEKVVGHGVTHFCTNKWDDAEQQFDSIDIIFLLRPNGSFVIWDNRHWSEKTNGSVGKSSTVMDGNWIVKKAGEDSSTIEIFGRLIEIKETAEFDSQEDMYDLAQNKRVGYFTEKENEHIFSEKNMVITSFNPHAPGAQDKFDACEAGGVYNKTLVPYEAAIKISSGRINGWFGSWGYLLQH
ncbi:MAG: discoidin domain-containing protein [Leptospirales bacterium]